jgi:hypothetical protein
MVRRSAPGSSRAGVGAGQATGDGRSPPAAPRDALGSGRMMSLLGAVADDAREILEVLGDALWLHSDLLQIATASPPGARTFGLGMAVVFWAGVSLLVGHSVPLFINRVRPGRFVLSMVLNGLLFVVSWLVWALVFTGIGTLLFGQHLSFPTTLLIISFSYAPYMFGFLILIPYLGPFLGRLLTGWSLLIVLVTVERVYSVTLPWALVHTGLGWLVLQLLNTTVGRPVLALRDRLLRSIAGRRLDLTPRELIRRVTRGAVAAAQRRQRR